MSEPIPVSSASFNLLLVAISSLLGLIFLAIGCNVLGWICLTTGCCFLTLMLMCILDIQEHKMKQNQKIIELLAELVNKENNN